MAQRLKRLPAMWETWVWSLGQEDSPGEGNGMPLQYSCLENPMNRGTWWATVNGVAKSQTRLSDFTFTFASLVAQRLKRLPAMWETWVWSLGREDSPGEGNGHPLQYSCLENLMDRGAWRATVHGLTKSQTRLKGLSTDVLHQVIFPSPKFFWGLKF